MSLIEYFFIFAFLGWGMEVIYQATSKGIIVNRGFLNGPICPIYGVGMVAVKMLLDSVQDISVFGLFLFGVVFSSLIELVGGFALHKLFHARWWDYSDKPLNFHGYICLEFSLIWGLAVLTTVKVICPVANNLNIPDNIANISIAICSIVFLADLSISASVAVGLNKKLTEINNLQAKLRMVSDPLSQQLGANALDAAQKMQHTRVQISLAKSEAEQELAERKAEMEKLLSRTKVFGAGRLLRAFPDLKKRD